MGEGDEGEEPELGEKEDRGVSGCVDGSRMVEKRRSKGSGKAREGTRYHCPKAGRSS